MQANQIRKRFIDFFVKKHDHKEISSASLIPENDPTVLFTTAGMHPLVPYLMGEVHPLGTRLVDYQKCLRTDDIEEVGDRSHLTFFEMLGNWSLGDYFKEGAIEMSYEFLTSKELGLGLDVKKLAVSCFEGDNDAPKDMDAYEVWSKLGIPEDRIAFLPKVDNWWGPAGQSGPCGPDTEIFYWTGEGEAPQSFDPENDLWVEIWNNVFMQYNKQLDESFHPLAQKNVDTGLGLERVTAILQGKDTPFETELFTPVMECISQLKTKDDILSERIIADHLRSAVFILGDEKGISPSNTDQGYVLRRLIRRAIRHAMKIGINDDFAGEIAGIFINNYQEVYQELAKNKDFILDQLLREEIQFKKTLVDGEKMFFKIIKKNDGKQISGKDAFKLYDTYGLPIEITKDLAKENDLTVNEEDFEKCYKEHQDLSRKGAEQKFSGGLADNSTETTALHTATHLLHQALRQVLGDHVQQKGSNITSERLRFDFSNPQKVERDKLDEVEKIINDVIQADLPISFQEMTVEEAKEKGAIGLFESKYGEKVKVYTIGDDNDFFSREICGGPHVSRTGELGEFKIKKEQASSSGVRRIKAVLK